MTCEAIRAALLAPPDLPWPPGVLAHLAGCEACAALAVEITLQHAPAVTVPATFAADVARRARLDTPLDVRRVSGAAAGAGAAAVLSAIALAWFGSAEGTAAVAPVAALLLACGEAIVLAVWTLHSDVTLARWRR